MFRLPKLESRFAPSNLESNGQSYFFHLLLVAHLNELQPQS